MTTSIIAGTHGEPAARSTARPRTRIYRAVGLLAVLGGIALILGAWLPWLSLFAGLHPIRGLDGENGQILAALGVLAVIVGARYVVSPNAASRWIFVMLGLVAAAFSGWLSIGVVATARDLSRDPLLVSALGPGVFVAFAGAVTLATTALFTADPDADAVGSTRPIVSALLAVGGAIHLALLPAHAAEGWLGGGFLMSGLVQLWLAREVLINGSGARLRLAAALSVLFAAAYVLAVTTGLPGLGGVGDEPSQPAPAAAPASAHGDRDGSGLLGPVEAVGEAGLLTIAVEFGAAALAIHVLRRRAAVA